MNELALGAIAFTILLLLLVIRIPVAVAMLFTGMMGYAAVSGWQPLLNYLKTAPYYQFSTYSLSVIPLFILMGEFARQAGMSRALFAAANDWLGHRRGGIAMAAIGGCAGFGAICGSSTATAATMAQVALPEMRHYRYSGALSTAALAAGGTLGILIPPSVILVIFALLTEQNISHMFIAAIIPAILAVLGYIAAVIIYVRIYPEAGPAAQKTDLNERLKNLVTIWPVALIFLLTIGGIYRGWFTPTEGAAVGAFGTGTLALLNSRMRWKELMNCLYGTARYTAMIFLILFGAEIFSAFLGLIHIPTHAAQLIGQSGLSPTLTMVLMLLFYFMLGCVMDSLSMILLTVPVFFPIVMALDFGLSSDQTAIWFGILVLIVVEIGLITPPVGMNVFIINTLAEDVPMGDSFRGILLFLMMDFIRVSLLILFPGIVLVLL